MSLIKEMEKWKKDLEELGVEKGRAEGRLEQAMADLKKLGFDTVEAAKAELEEASNARQLISTRRTLDITNPFIIKCFK